MKQIRGAGGGPATTVAQVMSTPFTEPDSLDSIQYAEIIDLLSEGEIEGFPSAKDYTRGTDTYNTALLKDVFLNNTPILRGDANPAAPQSSDYNFTNVSLQTRYGTQDQTYIAFSQDVQTEFSVNSKVEQAAPVTRTISDTTVDAVRVTVSTPQLQYISPTNDIQGTWFELAIEVSYNGGAYTRVVFDQIGGRTTDLYQREYRIDFTGDHPVSVRVIRISEDYSGTRVGDLFWSSYTEITYAKLRYPNSALAGLRIDASQFSSVPSRAYRIRGIKVRIPNNATVDSTTGALTYSGVWSGTFSAAQWTSDPAWCLYDLLTSKRYGTGDYITDEQLSKFDFYAASQYCSESVPDGLGGTEPRFSCNVNIQTLEEAYNVINQMASVFRAMPYWSVGSLALSQDSPQDSSYLFNTSNVTEEGFTYSGSGLKTRHTVVVVKYLDLDTRDAGYEVVEDQKAIAKYGVVKTAIDAFACTSRAQARRLGEWLLYTEQNESEVVAFTTSMEAGVVVRPGQVIEIADPVRSGERTGGRITEATLTTVTVDSVEDISFSGLNPKLSVVLPDGTVETKTISSRVSNVFTLSSAFSTTPQSGSVWIYQDDGIETQLFRVISIAEESGINYSISALSYNPGKYDYIERDVELQTRDITNLNEPPASPVDVVASELLYESNGQVLSKIILSWKVVSRASSYRVRYKFEEGGNWVQIDTRSPDFELLNNNVGTYYFEIYSLSTTLKVSAPTSYTFNAIGKTAPPETIPDLFIAPIDNKSAELYWPQTVDIDVRIGGKIRIRHSPIADGTATWGTSNDIVPAVSGNSTRKIVPLLEGTYFIRAVDSLGNESAGVASVVVDLPEPQDLLLTQEYREEDNSPPFNGTATSMSYSPGEGGLILASSTLVDDMATDGNWDGLGLIDYVGGAVAEGSYEFSETLDLGAVFDLDIRNILKSRAFEPDNLWDYRLENIDGWTSIDGDDLGAANCSLYVRTTNDDTTGTPTWGSYQPFVNNTARGRGFQFKVIATSGNSGENLVIEELGVITQLQRRVETQRNLTSGTSSYAVTFPNAFYAAPSVGITAQDMDTGDYFTVSSVTRTGFTVVFRDSGASIVSKVFDYQAVGHGREIT